MLLPLSIKTRPRFDTVQPESPASTRPSRGVGQLKLFTLEDRNAPGSLLDLLIAELADFGFDLPLPDPATLGTTSFTQNVDAPKPDADRPETAYVGDESHRRSENTSEPFGTTTDGIFGQFLDFEDLVSIPFTEGISFRTLDSETVEENGKSTPTTAEAPSDPRSGERPVWPVPAALSISVGKVDPPFAELLTDSSIGRSYAIYGGSTQIVSSAKVREVTFGGADLITIVADPETPAYGDPPQWVDSDLDGLTNDDPDTPSDRALPIGYPMNKDAVVSARFKANFTTIPYPIPPGQLMIRGANLLSAAQPYYFTIPATAATLVGNDVVLPETTIANPFPGTMNYGSIVIQWEFSNNGGTSWSSAGVSENQLYVPLDKPVLSVVYHTPIHLGVAAAAMAGAADETAAIAKIWDNFKKPESGLPQVKNTHIKAAYSGRALHYYKDWDVTSGDPKVLGAPTAKLLKDLDGTCVSWSFLFADALFDAGINAKKQIVYFEAKTRYRTPGTTVPYPENLLIKNWVFAGNGTNGNNTYLYQNTPKDPQNPASMFSKSVVGTWYYEWGALPAAEVTDQAGLPGQNTTNPRSTFQDHVVVKVNGSYYDPSYGLKWANVQAWEDGAVDGFMVYDGNNYVFRKNQTGANVQADTEELPFEKEGVTKVDGEYAGVPLPPPPP